MLIVAVALLMLIVSVVSCVVVGRGRARVERVTFGDPMRNVLGGLGDAGRKGKHKDRGERTHLA